MSDNKRSGRGFNGKGYYIALILCAAAIGISGYMYYRNANTEQPLVEHPTQDAQVDVIDPTQDVQAVATQPDHQEDPTKPVKQPVKTGLPLEGQTVAVYAMDSLTYNPTPRDWRVHNGIDIAAEAGTPVCSAADGTVSSIYEDDSMGTTVVIRHSEGYETVYASLDSKVAVAVGDSVTLGQTIGCVGNSALMESALGDHLHFSVSCDGEAIDPDSFFSLN